MTFETGIEYTNPDNQHLQLNWPGPRPATGRSPASSASTAAASAPATAKATTRQCIRLAEKGYVAVTVSYRLAPKYPFPAAIHDTKAAVRWLRANAKKYNIDPDRIGVTGGSAGGTWPSSSA